MSTVEVLYDMNQQVVSHSKVALFVGGGVIADFG